MNVTISVACLAMAATQDPIKFTFEQEPNNTIPLEGFKGQDEWIKVASTSRRHDVYIQPRGTHFDMTTRLAPNHPLYNPNTPASGPTLHIKL